MYVVNADDNTISVFIIDPDAGTLTASGDPIPVTGFDLTSLIVHVSGKFAYLTNEDSQTISVFAIDPASGAVTVAGNPVNSCGTGPTAIAGDPSGKFLYVSNESTGNICTFAVNASNGALSLIGSPVAAGDEPSSMNVDPSGKYLLVGNAGSDNVSVFAIDPNTGSRRIGLVSAHAYTSGALAAELLAHKFTRKTYVATITGEITTLDHAEKLRGFAATLAMLAPHLSLLPAVESHERPKEAYRQTMALLHGETKPQGLYICTANSIPVLQALEEEGLLSKIQVITTDLFQELVPLIETGKILATLYQRPFTQGIHGRTGTNNIER